MFDVYNKIKFICTHGFAFICDIRPETLSKDSMSFPNLYINYKSGTSIYLHADMIDYFINNYLDNMINPFVLVVGGNDFTMPNDYKNIDKLLKSDKLIFLFSQNNIGNHYKLKHLPIGLDYHTLFFNYVR